MKKITFQSLFLLGILVFTQSIFSQQRIAVIDEPFVILIDPADGSVVDPAFIDLTPLNQGTPKALLQVGQEIWITDQIEDRIDRFDLDGNYVSTISGGLDNIKGLELVDGEVWVTNAGSNNGAPGDAIVRFDTDGNNLGFIDTAGASSFDIIDVGGEVYVSYINAATKIERRDYSGAILGNVVGEGVVSFIQQMELNPSNNSVYAAVFSTSGGNSPGLYEFLISDGSILNYYDQGSLRGVALLDDGNVLISGSNGTFVMDTSNGNILATVTNDSSQYFGRISFCTTAPATPTGDANQTFNEGATIADIVVTPADVTWFASEDNALNNVDPLDPSTLLENGSTYYAVNIVDGCLSEPFAVTVEIILGIDDQVLGGLKLYPNPTDGIVTVKFTSEITSLRLSNLLGQEMLSQNVNRTETQLDLSSLSKGIYLLTIQVEGITRTVKVIKD
ncbi:MAG: hypothetical protein CMC74_09860 [Flavobacteriaceae bacterium]|nr:hypothetical protein [Flavobacteriaceae bacterium]|tara:strand:- start:85279 stop:86619 length:1341 start_codon:yes stop_codon:yes gene_type:complete